MDRVIFLVFRRMRAPALALIAVYAISIMGMVLIPGRTAEGVEWHMDFFHAFYFVSYMATTIGFGEIPYEFSPGQRIWTVISIYLTVITWLYAIGKILSLVQDPTFRQVVTERNFARAVRRVNGRFLIVCGFGDTGSLLVRSLDRRGIAAVVIDIDQERINDLELQDYASFVPGLCADASLSGTLTEAGLQHADCRGVIALTNSDEVNLRIAITTKLLNPALQVICRAETHDAEANMASFGTDYTINPFDTFGERLALALHSPGTHLLHEWLTGVPNTSLPEPLYPPHGRWILCGYGRFGKAVLSNLQSEGVDITIVEADPVRTGCQGRCVVGRGTESSTLDQAHIKEAVGIVAGTDNDANNLSIVITARELNSKLFAVARQNRHDNMPIFSAARLDLVMQRSEIIARKIFAIVTTPLLTEFLRLTRNQTNDWSNELVSRISAVTGDLVPEVWTVTLDMEQSPAVTAILSGKEPLRLDLLLRDHRARQEYLPCVPLLLQRGSAEFITPDGQFALRRGDRVLFCGPSRSRSRMEWTLQNPNVVRYLQTGEERPDGVIWRWLAKRSGAND